MQNEYADDEFEVSDNSFGGGSSNNFESAEQNIYEDDTSFDTGSDLDGLDMNLINDGGKAKKFTKIAMIATGGCIALAFVLIGSLYVSQKSAQKNMKEWVAQELAKAAEASGISEEDIDTIAERVTPLFYEEGGYTPDFTELSDEEVDALLDQIREPLEEYFSSEDSSILSETIVKKYVDKEYGDVADMSQRIKDLEAASKNIETKVTNLKETAAKGEKGDQGERGLQGLQGPQGPQGPAGQQGQNGQQGQTGSKGEHGEAGQNGRDGKDGAKGDKGEKGEKGDKGETGDSVYAVKVAGGADIIDKKSSTTLAHINNGEDGLSTFVIYSRDKSNASIEKPADAKYVAIVTEQTAKELKNADGSANIEAIKNRANSLNLWQEMTSMLTEEVPDSLQEKVLGEKQTMLVLN